MKFISKDLLKLEKYIAGVRDNLERPSIPDNIRQEYKEQLTKTESILRNIANLIKHQAL